MKRVQTAAAALTALALTAALAVPVWAETAGTDLIDTSSGTAEKEVHGTYNREAVYHLDISWGSMEFTYEPGVWTPEKTDGSDLLGYDKKTDTDTGNKIGVGWDNSNETINAITVTNKSNANIQLTFKYAAESGYEEISGGFYETVSAYGARKKIDETKGIWMQRADANISGMAYDSNATEGNHEITSVVKGIASEAKLVLVLSGRPKKNITNQKIGTVTITLTDAGDEDPAEGTYSMKYNQKTSD